MKKEIKYTDKGYSYIECTREECYKWGGACICDEKCEECEYNIEFEKALKERRE